MLDALRELLLEEPGPYQDEMVVFLLDEFNILVTASAISHALKSMSAFRSYHLVYVDESGCDERVGFRRAGWDPLGVTVVPLASFDGERRYPCCRGFSRTRPIAFFTKTLSSSPCTNADHGRSRNLCLSWTMHHSTVVIESKRCDAMQEESCYVASLGAPPPTLAG